MICLRCGYCCKNYMVVIVDNPEKGLVSENLIVHEGKNEACKHLKGDIPGEYWCVLYDKPWYKKTPCFSHGQIERNPDNECRMGRYVLDDQ